MNWPAPGVSPVSALVVEPDEADRKFFVTTLTSAGVQVIEADNFRSAREYLEGREPQLLVTEIQLGPYNGLHLALLGRLMSPQMSLVVTSRWCDPVLQLYGEQFGAVFIQKPMTQGELFTALVLAATREPIVTREVVAATPAVRGRRCKRRRRDIASFLLLEALQR